MKTPFDLKPETVTAPAADISEIRRRAARARWSALTKAVKAFPHLAGLPERDLARNACRLVIPGLSGLELLALANAAGPLKEAKR